MKTIVLTAIFCASTCFAVPERPLTKTEKKQIADTAYNLSVACWQNPRCDQKAEKRRLIDRLRYRYRAHRKVIAPIVNESWENGRGATGNAGNTKLVQVRNENWHFGNNNPRSPRRGFLEWMDEANELAGNTLRYDDGFGDPSTRRDDEKLFYVNYFLKGETPRQAVAHYRRDYARWNGGGDP